MYTISGLPAIATEKFRAPARASLAEIAPLVAVQDRATRNPTGMLIASALQSNVPVIT